MYDGQGSLGLPGVLCARKYPQGENLHFCGSVKACLTFIPGTREGAATKYLTGRGPLVSREYSIPRKYLPGENVHKIRGSVKICIRWLKICIRIFKLNNFCLGMHNLQQKPWFSAKFMLLLLEKLINNIYKIGWFPVRLNEEMVP